MPALDGLPNAALGANVIFIIPSTSEKHVMPRLTGRLTVTTRPAIVIFEGGTPLTRTVDGTTARGRRSARGSVIATGTPVGRPHWSTVGI